MADDNILNPESLSPPPEPPVKKEYTIINTVGTVDDILTRLINLNDNNEEHEPTCIICSSSYREELEKKWQDTPDHKIIRETFKGKISGKLSNAVIDNHIKVHLEGGVKALQKKEYTNRIQTLSSVEMTTLDRIRLALSVLTERLLGVNSIIPNATTSPAEVEKIKSSETSRLMAAYGNLLKLQASIMGEMQSNGELIIIPRQPFIDTFNKAILNAKSNEEKEAIKQILNSLADLSRKTQ